MAAVSKRGQVEAEIATDQAIHVNRQDNDPQRANKHTRPPKQCCVAALTRRPIIAVVDMSGGGSPSEAQSDLCW